MRQQVNATVTLTFDADARLSPTQLAAMIQGALEPIADILAEEGAHDPLFLTRWKVDRIDEEAAIYGNAPAAGL